jgi:hypothetical protein
MAELTAETVREIVKIEVNTLRLEMREGFASSRVETADGINRVLETVQSLSYEDRDEMSGLRGRLHDHNERIAKLERLNNLR